MKFRALEPQDIEVRVGGVYKSGVTFLLYKNARVDMSILDETVGEFNWQRDHKEVKGNLYCGIGIWDEAKSQWIWKWDCGVESRKDADGNEKKGEASDSFKRAGTNWGIGRELYTSPFIYLACATNPKQNGKGYELNDPNEIKGIYVSEFETAITDDKRVITKIVLSQRSQGKKYDIFKWERR